MSNKEIVNYLKEIQNDIDIRKVGEFEKFVAIDNAIKVFQEKVREDILEEFCDGNVSSMAATLKENGYEVSGKTIGEIVEEIAKRWN